MTVKKNIQKLGSTMSGMVIPNLGAFLAWGLITSLGIALKNDMLKEFIGPTLRYLLPILIAFSAGNKIYGYRGGVIATVATMGCIIGSEITMFLGAMIIGPISAMVIKKFDSKIERKIPTGFELLVNNFSIGIIGAILAVLGYLLISPCIEYLTVVLASGVDFLIQRRLLALTAIFIEPAKIFFLNNAIGQGILTPLGTAQLEEAGKSVLFLLESNCGPGLGVLAAYMVAAKGNSKASATGASIIHLFGGIHEIYFPFVLMNLKLILPLILGGMTSTFIFSLFNVGLHGVSSPGSIITIMIMSAAGDRLFILLGILAGALVTFLTSIPIIKSANQSDEELSKAAIEMENIKGKKSRVRSTFGIESDNETVAASKEGIDFKNVKKIVYACDAGLGSSAMGASVLNKKILKAGINDIDVFHKAITDLPVEADIMVVHDNLYERAIEKQGDIYTIRIFDYLNAKEYDELVNNLIESRK